MPLYEFVCASCMARTEVFTRSVTAVLAPSCQRCGGRDLRRAVSRFAFHRSESEIYGDMGKLLDVDVDENDPEAMAHWARKMKDRLGDAGDPELDELIREGSGLASGETYDAGAVVGSADGDF